MTVRSLATKLAAVPERAIDGLPSFPANPWRRRRTWTAGESIAAFGLGLAVGVAIGLLLHVGPSAGEQALSTSGEAPGQYT